MGRSSLLLPRLFCLFSTGCLSLGVPPPGAAERREVTVLPSEDERPCDDVLFDAFSAPDHLLETEDVPCDPSLEAYCLTLTPELRGVARTADPMDALASSAEAFDAFLLSDDPRILDRARALADLAVTGASSYAAFAALGPEPQDFAASASPAAVAMALERAYAVAWALRGPPSHRASARAPLGWVAVSPEDDPPARPVNVPAGPYLQTDLSVAVSLGDGSSRVVRTRVMIASTHPAAEPSVPGSLVGGVPPEPAASLPSTGDVILFSPGHSSLAEEMSSLAQALLRERADEDGPLTIVAVDLPSNAYAERIDPEEILSSAAGADDALLRFHDAFLDGVVRALDDHTPGASDRIVAMIGGSLGGNLALRLAEQSRPWVRRVVSWSPASIDASWERARLPFVAGDDEYIDVVKHEAVRQTRDASVAPELAESRGQFFGDGVLGVRTQADYWYRPAWACRDMMIGEGLVQLGEIYDGRYRRWHYRVAYEQLVASHVDNRAGDADSSRPFERIGVPLLLIAGEDDDAMPMQTFSFVQRLAPHLGVAGATVFLLDTGHAVHSERPELLASLIADFLRST